MPRFVILEHDQPTLHWDFMLEAGDVLRTWRLTAPPAVGQQIAAEPSFAHRPLYLDYEGPISGGRGFVKRWDAGTFRWEADERDRVVVRVDGQKIRGSVSLTKASAGAWFLALDAGG
jgi:hypothetical protein